MKRVLLLVLTIVSLVSFQGCKPDDTETGKTNDVHMNCIVGKIIEIRDSNTVLIEITKERGGYKKEDKVLIHYSEFVQSDYDTIDGDQTLSEPEINDEVTLGFWPENVKQQEEYDYIEVKELLKPINN